MSRMIESGLFHSTCRGRSSLAGPLAEADIKTIYTKMIERGLMYEGLLYRQFVAYT